MNSESTDYSYENIQANRIYHDYVAKKYENDLQVRFGVGHPNCRKRLEWLKNHYSIKKGNLLILNLGVGTGNLIKKSEEIFGCTIGLDISRNMLQKAKRYTDRLIQGNAIQIPLKSQSLNIVFCIAVLHHIYDLEAFFRSVYRVLRPGCIFYSDYDLNKRFCNSIAKVYPLQLLFSLYKKLTYIFIFRRDYYRFKKIHDLAEYHEEFHQGLEPEKVADIAQKVGFSKVDWICHSDSPNLDYPKRGRLIHRFLELLLLPFSKDYTERAKIFSLIAIK
jgi:ubiquinone/menaquinone biosynthesis C-methylase UbiE